MNTPISGLTNGEINFNGWKTFVTPLNITDKSKWTAVRHLRITLKKGPNTATKGQIKIATVALSGTAWNVPDGTDPHVFQVAGINNVDNADYEPIFSASGDGKEVFNYLYGSIDNLKEATDSANAKDQALNITFNTTALPEVNDSAAPPDLTGERYASRNFSTMDFTQHRQMRFLLHSQAANAGSQFFLKVGTEENYDKVVVPLDYTGWRLISLNMVDTNGDAIPDAFEDDSDSSFGLNV